MPSPEPVDVTRILHDLQSGKVDHEEATSLLFSLIFEELRRIAGRLMVNERRDHTLQATALVNEAYLKLAGAQNLDWQNRAHFFGVAARVMRQVLVDYARERAAAKRGGGWQRVTMEGLGQDPEYDYRILELEDALKKLGNEHGRMARVVELRLFGGLKMKEIAHVVGSSRRTVQEDWRVARMWLGRELAEGRSPDSFEAGDRPV